MTPATYAYTRHLLDTAGRHDLPAGLAAVLPCQWSYGELATRLAAAMPADPVYADWIAMFAGDGYDELVQASTSLLDQHADPADAALVRTQARAASVQAGLARLDQIAVDDAVPVPVLAALRASLDGKARRYRQVLDRLETAEDPAPATLGSSDYEAALQARRAVIDAQREELLRWRDAGHLPDASLRILEGELDHEERTLPPHDAH
jgi:hypothetical protein